MDTAYSLFPCPGARPMADIDVLVREDDRAEAIRAIGLPADPPVWGETTLRSPNQPREPLSLFRIEEGDAWSVDLHHRLNFLVAPPDQLALLDDADRFVTCRRHPVISHAHVLAEPARLLHLAVHPVAACIA